MRPIKNTFKNYQEAKQSARGEIIVDHLSYLKTTRVRFKYITDLADILAREITIREGTSCNKATLLRNNRYKALLLNFMASQIGNGTKTIDRNAIVDDRAKALLLSAELEAGNGKHEIARLKMYIRSLESKLAETGQSTTLFDAQNNSNAILTIEAESIRLSFTLTCKALLAILNHYSDLVKVDSQVEQIIDPSLRKNNVIVDESTAAPFFEWLRSQEGIGV
jgi:hypothetical protein